MVKETDIETGGSVIFLDFDGVCNSFERGSYLTTPPDRYGPDDRILKRIREICRKCGAKVVISSNWRRYPLEGTFRFEGKDFTNPLGELLGIIGDLVIGALPHDRHITKSEALELWMDDHPRFRGRYAILDDDYREGFQNVPKFRRNFWLVDRKYGLSERIKDEIMEHLLK